MENSDSKLKSFFSQTGTKISEALNEQVWFQQLKGKWEELDPQSRFYLKSGAAALGVLGVLGVIMSSIMSVNGLKRELAEKSDLLNLIQTSNEELRRLRTGSSGARAAGGDKPDWPGFFHGTADTIGVPRTSVEISPEKPGSTGDLAKESLYDVTLKRVNIRQVVQYAFNLENGNRPVKLRALLIDTKNDAEGYMDAKLSVSAFAVKQ